MSMWRNGKCLTNPPFVDKFSGVALDAFLVLKNVKAERNNIQTNTQTYTYYSGIRNSLRFLCHIRT